MAIPNFFIVGAPKCGTSGLYNHLKSHPQIFMATPKELNYFSTDLNSPEFVRDPDWYFSLFEDADKYDRVGEASVWYLFSKVAAKKISELSPDAKIIAIFRNPVEMIHSYHSQRIWNRTEDIDDFGAAIDAIPERAASRSLPAKADPVETLDYVEIARYPEQLKRYYDAFGHENVHVIVFDDLINNPASVHKAVFEFLGVQTDVRLNTVDNQMTRNANKRPRSEFVNHLILSPPKWMKSLLRVLLPNADARIRVWKRLRRLNIEWKPRPDMSPELRIRLVSEYADDIVRFGNMIGRDLTNVWR